MNDRDAAILLQCVTPVAKVDVDHLFLDNAEVGIGMNLYVGSKIIPAPATLRFLAVILALQENLHRQQDIELQV